MELLDRYLQAVQKHLYFGRQGDVIAELRANLEAQLEDRESELGRPMNQQEAEEWLKGLGHPMMMAAKYQPVQYLIGPGLFPVYLYVLKLVFIWATIVYAVVAAVVIPLTTQGQTSIVESVVRWPGVLLNSAMWVTLVFAAMEFLQRTSPGLIPQLDQVTADWKPGSLPAMEKPQQFGWKPTSYVKAVAEVVFGFLFLVWLLLVPRYPFLMMGPGAVALKTLPLTLAPIWWKFYWVVLGLNAVQLAWRCVDLMRDTWQQNRAAQHITSKVFGLIGIAILVWAPDQILFVVNPLVAGEGTKNYELMDQVNKSVHLGLMVVMAIVVLQGAWDLVQVGMRANQGSGVRGQ